jgi:hypothetical protein
MEYNTSRAPLIIPEYGRSIQEMVQYAVNLPTIEERTHAAKTIVQAMSILNPQLKDMTDYKHKLWDHMFIISDFKLDCESPYPMPDREATKKKPERIAYPQKTIRARHYGSIVENMIAEAKKMNIPVIALANTDCDIKEIDYPIVGNDSSTTSISFFVSEIVKAYKAGKTTKA